LQIEKGSAAAERTDPIGTLVPILLVNLLYSQNPLSTLSWSLHFILYYLFLAILGSDLKGSAQPADSKAGRSDPQQKFENLRIYDLKFILTLPLLFQTILAVSQVSLGRSVGGLLYYLGERSVAVGSPNIALATFMDNVVLRAYGTFSHPNIIAGFAVISLLITIQLRKQRAVRRSDPLRKSWLLAKMFSRTFKTSSETGSDLIGILLPLLLTILLILLTQSRAAGLALFGFVIPLYFFKSIRTRLVYFAILLIPLSYFLFTPPRSDLSASQRLDLQRLSLKVIQATPVFGTGAQASISTYPAISPTTRLLQPDHNSFTLILSWFGLFGILAFLYSLRSHLIPLSYFLIPILPLLLLDHYLLTSPQGLFVFMLYLGLVGLQRPHNQTTGRQRV